MRKVLISLAAVAVVVGGVAAMSAFEAHIINVTAHIENALAVDPTEIDFGTVFPQEFLEEFFTVNLSTSFLAEDNADDVEYVIKQKPKPIWPIPEGCELFNTEATIDDARAYCHDHPENLDCCYLSLCPYLSKTDADPDDQNDVSHPSYYVDPTPEEPNSGDEFCEDPGLDATGRLAKSQNDASDDWAIDLKVPPIDGYVGQDWPETCPVLDENDQDYGCDLWIEVTGISRVEQPGENTDSLSLENKDADGWYVINDETYGTLVYVLAGSTFDFTLTAQGLQPNTSYSLIYYADGWPGNNPGALIWSGSTDGDGKINTNGNPDLGMDLPDSADANHPTGAKIWLVLSSDYDAGSTSMTAWNQTQYLFEYNLITYDDTDIP